MRLLEKSKFSERHSHLTNFMNHHKQRAFSKRHENAAGGPFAFAWACFFNRPNRGRKYFPSLSAVK